MRWLFVLLLLTAGCEGGVSALGGASPDLPNPPDVEPPPDLGECRTPNFYAFEGLRSSCEGCHGVGTSAPSFVSLESFERLIAYNPAWVSPGAPQDSALLPMLEGTGTGQNAQMPLGEKSFSELAAEGSTHISMDEVRTWISDLEVCVVPDRTDIPLLRRLRAEQVVASLTQQLGIDPDTRLTAPHLRELRGADRATWAALGGPNYLAANPRQNEMTSTFTEYLVPMSQRWCRESVNNNDALFEHTTRDSDGGTELPAIRDNIEYLYLHMLGMSASSEDIDDMADLYLTYETREGSREAWTAVCATFIRDPRWLSY